MTYSLFKNVKSRCSLLKLMQFNKTHFNKCSFFKLDSWVCITWGSPALSLVCHQVLHVDKMLSLLSLSSAMHASIITIQLYVVVIILSSIQCKQIFTILHSYMPYILTLFNKCCGNITPVCQSTLVESSGPNYNNIV